VTVTKLAGTDTAVVLSNSTATVTASTITIGISAIDGATGNPKPTSRLTWSGIKVRPTAGTPLVSGNITNSGTAPITGITGTTSFGTLTEVVGAASAYRITAASITPAAAANDLLTIKLVDKSGNVTNFTGDKNLTFSGLNNAPDGTVPTVTSKTGPPVNFGTATTISSPWR